MTTTESTIYDEERQREPPIKIQNTNNKIQNKIQNMTKGGTESHPSIMRGRQLVEINRRLTGVLAHGSKVTWIMMMMTLKMMIKYEHRRLEFVTLRKFHIFKFSLQPNLMI